MKKNICVFLALLALAGMMAGCGPGLSFKTDDGGTVRFGKDGMEVKGKDGESSMTFGGENGTSLPKGYPKDLVPVIGGAKIEMATKSTENSKVSYWVTYTCNKEPADAYAFYTDKLNDLTEQNTLEMGGVYSISGKKNGNAISVTVSEYTGVAKTYVQISIAEQ